MSAQTAPRSAIAAAMVGFSLLGGCTHSVHQVALGRFDELPPDARVHPVQATAVQDVLIATGDTDFVDEAMRTLADQCPHGEIMGIQARHSTSLGFLVHTNRLVLTGYCVERGAPPRDRARTARAER